MSRLPTPGADNGTWGNILNDYLSQSHASDGTLKAGSVGSSQVQDGALPKTKLDTTTQASLTKADGSLQASNNLSDVTAGTARTNLGLGTAATMTPATLAADSAFSGTYAARRTPDLLGFDAALANRANAPCDILVVADSIGEGAGASVPARWIAHLRDFLRQQYPTLNVSGGQGYTTAWYATLGSGVGGAPTEGGSVTHSANGLGHRSSILGAGATLTYSAVACTSFQIRCLRSSTDAFDISIDGGAATHVTAGPTGEFTYSSGVLTRTAHSIVITQVAGSPEIEGVIYYDGDESKGVRVWDSCKGGSKAADWSTASGGSQAWISAATGTSITPSLLIVALGTNDALTVSAATYATDVTNLIAAARATWANVPVLLVGPYQPPSRQSGTVSAWSAYGAALRSIAAADPAIDYLDMMDRIGLIATDTYGILIDTTHPNALGHMIYGQLVSDYLRPAMRDATYGSVTNIKTESLVLDYPNTGSVMPAVPINRGALLYADGGNAAIMGLSGLGDICNNLARTQAISTNATLRAVWRYARITTAASTITITLPAAVPSQRHTIKKIDSGAGTVVITRAGSDTIEGATTKTLSGQWSYITLVGGATGSWEIEGQGGTVA